MHRANPTFEVRTPRAILRGAESLADLVALTLGPVGRAVLIDRTGAPPLIGGDGYTVATHFDVADPVAQSGVQALRNLAWEMSRDHGDGAATAVVLARAVLAGLVRMAAAGHDPQRLGEAVARQAQIIAARIREKAIPAGDGSILAAVATTACGDADLGRTIGDAFEAAGEAGTVIVEAGYGTADEIEKRPGLHFSSGWLSPVFVTDEESGRAIHDDAYILVASGRIEKFDDILPVLEAFVRNRKPLIVIASEVVGEALATLVVNRRKAGAPLCAVTAPGTGAWRAMNLADIAAATGATLIGDESGHRLADIKPAMVGRASRVEIGRNSTTIVGGAADARNLQARLAAIRADIAAARYLAYDREQHELRLARLSGAIATVRIGAPTKAALDHRLTAARCAVAATRSARAGGVVAGGGAALLHAAVQAARTTIGGETEHAAAGVLERALAAPLRAIVANRGRDASYMAGLVAAGSNAADGFDAVGDRYGDLIAAGVVDACELTVEAMLRAVSTAVMLASVAAATVPPAKRNSSRGAA
ncbi:chaperonin GroEL [Aquamicrobium terrae]